MEGKLKLSAAVELFVLSALSLYIELFAIRWICADIRAFTVLSTLPLIACFIGLGVGFALGRDAIFKYFPCFVMAFVLVMKIADLSGLCFFAFPSTAVFVWQNLVYSGPVSAGQVLLFLLTIPLALAPAGLMMAALGARLGVIFNEFAPLRSYMLNISGSLFGAVLFPILSYCRLGPGELLLPVIALYLFCVLLLPWYRLRKSSGVSSPKAVLSALVLPAVLLAAPLPTLLPSSHARSLAEAWLPYQVGPTSTFWSPYQRIDVNFFKLAPQPDRIGQDVLVGMELGVNRAFYQYFFNDSVQNTSGVKLPDELERALETRKTEYALPFELHQGAGKRKILIVGSGLGQNVGAALAAVKVQGAAVDAVDIDPAILDLGRRYNRAYVDSRVRIICDDARHFMETAGPENKYDVICFSLLDSHAVTGCASVRVDNYVYTVESFRKALKLLKPGGLLTVSFALVPANLWIGERLACTMKEAAGYEPWMITSNRPGLVTERFFVLGEAVRNGQLKVPDTWAALPVSGLYNRVISDDWPYLYVRENIIDGPYLMVLAELLLLALVAAGRFIKGPYTHSDRQMFFLGAAFLLMELRAISSLSLVYGSTWMTSAVAIGSILAAVLLANWFVLRCARVSMVPVWILLNLSLALSYFVSPAIIGREPVSCFFLTLIEILPLGLASIIFASAFKENGGPRAYAMNLLGALLGGILEYLSNYLGIRALVLVAFLLYLLALPGRRK